MFENGQKVRIVNGSRYIDQRTGETIDGKKGAVIDTWIGTNGESECMVRFSSKSTTWIKQGCLEIWEW